EGLRVYYQMVGDGAETVVIPSAAWLAADLAPLAAGRMCIFFDPRGRGGSDAVTHTDEVAPGYEVEDVETIRRHFGLEQMALLGWSATAGDMALYALAYPQRVSRLVLLS